MDAPAWPLGAHEEQLVRELARMIERGGGWRFLNAPVVSVCAEDYPDPCEENRAGVAIVLARTMWHAHLDLDLVVEDVREPAPDPHRDVRVTRLELVEVDDRRARFELSSVGNDDVPGRCAHEIGRAYLAHLARAGHPFRTPDAGPPTLAEGTIAAVALGLGVLATNSARHDRSGGRLVGSYATVEWVVDHAGGLPHDEVALLLAVQATVRDDVLPALETLRPMQAAAVAAWRDVLDDHETELREMLGLDRADVTAPSRPAHPRAPSIEAKIDERDLHTYNRGRRTYRLRQHRGLHGAFAGLVTMPALGAAGTALVGLPSAVIASTAIVSLVVGPIAGWVTGRRLRYFDCACCGRKIKIDAAECWFCGGRVAGEIATAVDRLDRDEELDRLEAAEREAAEVAGGSS